MRNDFTKATKKTIASRAGFQCSYLNCPIRTAGPDLSTGGSLQAGIAAHIYSASPDGPRGQGGLNRQELMHHQNGIWLCAKHAILVDANGGVGHPSGKLFSYKRLHEHRVQKEILGVCSTIGWIEEFELIRSPLFVSGATVRLGKLTLLFGNNSIGKTSFGRYLGGVFDTRQLLNWHKPGKIDLEFRLKYYNPDPVSMRFSVSKERPVQYEINGIATSRNPINCNVITVPEFDVKTEGNDKSFIADILKLPEWEIDELVNSVNSFLHSYYRDYRFEVDEDEGTTTLRLNLSRDEYAPRVFSCLASTEQKLVFIDFATAAARRSANLEPTLLVLDCNLLFGVKYFDKLESQLLAPENHFQTIMTMRLDSIDLSDVQWRGWEVVRLYRKKDHLTLFSQDPKMKIEAEPWDLSFLKSRGKKLR